MDAPDLARARFHHDVAERDLAVATQGDLSVATHRYDRGSVEVFHGWICVKMEAGSLRIKLFSRNDTRKLAQALDAEQNANELACAANFDRRTGLLELRQHIQHEIGGSRIDAFR